jgi:hypothetical protein
VISSVVHLLFSLPNVRVEELVHKLMEHSCAIDVLVKLGRVRHASGVGDVLPLGTYSAEVDDEVEVCANVLGQWIVLQDVAFAAEIRAEPSVSIKGHQLGS